MTSGVLWQPSGNFGERRGSARPDMVVLHYTAMAAARAAIERLCDPQYEVSAHYVIGETGQIWQLVREEDRAWHAGAGQWGDHCDVNSHSIGIEIANPGCCPFSAGQINALEDLLAGIMHRWSIPPERVVGHSDVAPERKIDPGPRFDWRRLAMSGLSIWPQLAEAGDFWRDARRFGYGVTAYNQADVLAAFRSRFRPWALAATETPTGRAEDHIDDEDRQIMQSLAKNWPVQGNVSPVD